MLRPTPAETLAGLQRTLLALAAELASPYSQAQAASAAITLGMLATALDRQAEYDREELKDLSASLTALKGAGELSAELNAALRRGDGAARAMPPDRHALEAVLAEFAAALALGGLPEPAEKIVRAYFARHLERLRTLLGTTSMSG